MKKEKLGTNYLKDGNGGGFVVSYYMLNDSARGSYGAALERTTGEPEVLETRRGKRGLFEQTGSRTFHSAADQI